MTGLQMLLEKEQGPSYSRMAKQESLSCLQLLTKQTLKPWYSQHLKPLSVIICETCLSWLPVLFVHAGIWNWLAFAYPGFLGLRYISQSVALETGWSLVPCITIQLWRKQRGAFQPKLFYDSICCFWHPVIWAIRERFFVFVFITRSKQIPFHAPTLRMMNDLLRAVVLFSFFFFPSLNIHKRILIIERTWFFQQKRGGPAKVNILAQDSVVCHILF